MPSVDTRHARRVAIERVRPQIDCGRFAIKRVVGEKVVVTADVMADGHDVVACALRHRQVGAALWRFAPMQALGNDAWQGEFFVEEMGVHEYTVEGWIDHFASWVHDMRKRLEAGQNVTVDLLIGAELVARAACRATGEDKKSLETWRDRLSAQSAKGDQPDGAALDQLSELARRYPDKEFAATSEPLRITVDRERGRFGAWYEMFPRSTAAQPGRHGSFRDCIRRLDYVAGMGFDILYLPPIHPIGMNFRKGKNNSVTAAEGEPGVPWAIGSAQGGHQSIHPELGTLAEFHALILAAKERGIEIALDIAFQCSPDHPYVKEHPDWFRARPDDTIQYAENPPKKYQDIYPFDFESRDWKSLWEELKQVVLFWAGQGVRVFRVDNPHTKPFAFWEWMIAEVKSAYPDALFLSEAFTRPKIMHRLAKLGFTQSYTYFTWRNTKAEFIEYFTELTATDAKEYFRGNLWPNTPDILVEHLQTGGRPAFMARLLLAATLGPSYGIYGPAYELMEHDPREPGSEEYLNSEKYEVRHWDLDRPDSLRDFIARVNQVRREHRALQSNDTLRFHTTDNEQLLAYSKHADGRLLLAVVNLDFHHEQHGYVELPLAELGISADRPFELEDLISGARFTWNGPRNFVELDPSRTPAHLLRVDVEQR